MRVNYIEPVIMVATIVRWLLLATITGAIVGTGVSGFLQALFFLSQHTAHVSLGLQMALLPLAGILNGLLLHYGYREPGSYARDSVITAIHVRAGAMSHKTILVKPVAALITLALGGSAGKEGPCSHIGGTLASWFGKLVRLDPEMQKRIVACGVSAGFASVFGTPLAGAIYGIEMLVIGRVRHDFIFPAVIAAITAFEVGKYWGMTYDYFPVHISSDFSSFLAIRITPIAAVLMGFELFGSSAGPYFATACVTAYIVVGHRSVYSGQLLGYSKSLWVRSAHDAPLEPGKIHISYSLLRRLGYFRSNRWRK